MCTMTVPGSGGEALAMLRSSAGYLADLDAASMPAEELGRYIRELVQGDAVTTAALARLLAAFDAKDGHLADGQRSLGTWLVHYADLGIMPTSGEESLVSAERVDVEIGIIAAHPRAAGHAGGCIRSVRSAVSR